jgi:hypothetical protein
MNLFAHVLVVIQSAYQLRRGVCLFQLRRLSLVPSQDRSRTAPVTKGAAYQYEENRFAVQSQQMPPRVK